MKLIICAIFCLSGIACLGQTASKFNDTAFLQPIEVTATRAAENAPFAKTNIGKIEIAKNNSGADLPFLLNHTPSVVANSDAGNGVGYTGIRIRGSDATRINVTLNGIPYNDAESQGSFFVDLPDIASSANSIQVQRGVGTSSNGAGAFGATINIGTNEINEGRYVELNNSYGSYNTMKNTFRFGSGVMGKHITVDGRISRISSDGYIDRAKSDLRSFYFSTAWVDEKNSLRLNILSGKEKTYQAWNGVPENLLTTNRTFNSAGTEKPGEPYDNETDNYTQTHYQLFYNHRFSSTWKTSVAAFLTKGDGYYEQYKAAQALADYGLPDFNDGGTVISETDLVRQLWLDNSFYGAIFSLEHSRKSTRLNFGGGWSRYDGRHFGKIVKAVEQQAVPQDHQWYNLPADKKDASIYGKWTQQLGSGWQSFLDLQYRYVDYRINGFRDNPSLLINNYYSFLNPKLGITYQQNNWITYFSYGVASKEPNRDDFEAGNTSQPKPERLHDFEWGIEKRSGDHSYGANLYYMKYRDQLVLIGNINDVGAYTRTNIPDSYRAGIELQAKGKLLAWLNASANLALSENKIKDYTNLVDDYDNGGTKAFHYQKTDISFSPAIVGGAAINFIPVENAEISLSGKYVGRQYLDNTSQKARSLDPYFVQDLRLAYTLTWKSFKEINLFVQLNNIFNSKYEANGYTFSYISGGLTTENYYFPMAPFNCMAGLNIRL